MNNPYTSYGPGYTPPAGQAFRPTGSSNNETLLAGIAHLSSFVAPILAPLIIWLVVRDTMPYASRQAKQAFFFHLILSIITGVFGVILFFIFTTTFFAAAAQAQSTDVAPTFVFSAWFFLGIGVLTLVGLGGQALSIYGAVQAFQGKPFSYPLLGWL